MLANIRSTRQSTNSKTMRNLLPHFIAEQCRQNSFEGTFSACALFVDVEGFTPMTEALMEHGSEGAEALSQILNAIFTPLVDAVYHNGGFITNFPGDAFTAIFPDDASPLSLLQAAEQVRAGFSMFGEQHTKFGDFDVGVRTGMSVGQVEWGIIGTDDKSFFFRGEALDHCAAGKRLAQRAEIIVDESVMRMIEPGQLDVEEVGEGYYRMMRVLEDSVKAPAPLARRPLSKKVILQFLPKEVVEFHGAGEFRDVASAFIFFEGISQVAEMNSFATIVLERAREFSGYVKEIECTEGGVIPCFFGVPVTFENNTERALNFIVAVQQDITKQSELALLKMRVGISYGRVFAGIIGGPQRSQYTLIGSMVNLAARMGTKAAWGEVHVSEKVTHQQGFAFRDNGEIIYKGFAQPIRTYTLIGESASGGESFFSATMVGRTEELQLLEVFAEPIFAGAFAGIAYIYGEAGIGKSQLAHSFRQSLSAGHDVAWLICQADQILRKPFNPFISFLRGYFSQGASASVDENKATFERILEELIQDVANRSSAENASKAEEIRRELARIRPIIGALLGLSWEGSLYEQLDAKGRYENTLFALKTLFIAESLLRPTVIQIEDGHWFDSDSAAAVTVLMRNIASSPILLLVTSRYNDDGSAPRIDLDDVPEINVRVNNLAEGDLAAFAEARTGGQLSGQLQQLLVEKTRGNPFFAQQMLLYFTDHDMLEQSDDGWRMRPDALHQSALPETISAMLIARIDRLSQRVKDVVKAAAVIGQEFELTILSAVLKNDITKEVRHGEQRQIWALLNELRYIFKHALLRDAAYEMQLHARLRELHRLTAEAMEETFAENLAERSTDIAYHYEKAEVEDKAIEYLEKAGDYAKEQYQNLQAIELYDRLLEHLDGNQEPVGLRIDISMKMGDVLELIGEWTRAAALYRELVIAAERAGDHHRTAHARRRLGRINWLQGEYDEAMEDLTEALRICEELGDRPGISAAVGTMGVVHFNRGEYDRALECFGQDEAICRELGDRAGLSVAIGNMGLVYYDRGEYDRALECHREQEAICRELGDRLVLSKANGNMGLVYYDRGEYDRALECYREQEAICRELGNRHGLSLAIGNTGNVYADRGEYDRALECYAQATEGHREIGFHYGLASWLAGTAHVLLELSVAGGEMPTYLPTYVPGAAHGTWHAMSLRTTRSHAEESVAISDEISTPDTLFSGSILLARLEAAEGSRDVALQHLHTMLQEATDDDQHAELHYWLWKIQVDARLQPAQPKLASRAHAKDVRLPDPGDHRLEALRLYESLLAKTPKQEYRNRIDELRASAFV
jgi:class 3 adenylate cyclase/tetratricopeptide (TPR) repeat protein